MMCFIDRFEIAVNSPDDCVKGGLFLEAKVLRGRGRGRACGRSHCKIVKLA